MSCQIHLIDIWIFLCQIGKGVVALKDGEQNENI